MSVTSRTARTAVERTQAKARERYANKVNHCSQSCRNQIEHLAQNFKHKEAYRPLEELAQKIALMICEVGAESAKAEAARTELPKINAS